MPKKKRNRPKSPAEATTPPDYTATADLVDRRLPALFLALGLLLGTLYALIMPPMQVADEMMHFARAYSVSRGVCVASPDVDIPKSFAQLNDLFPHWLEKVRKISLDDLRLALKIPLNDRDMAGNARQRSLEGFVNQNLYYCAPYLPEAMVLSLGRRASLPPLLLMYFCRMANLISYVLPTYLALRLLPDFRILLFCIALMPMALHQAASVSADSTIIAVSFLFTAYVFRLAFAPDPVKLGLRHHLILAILIVFLVLSKTFLCAVFLLLLIPAASFPSRRSRWLAMAGYFLLAIVCAAVWQHVNQPSMQRMAEERMTQGTDMAANMRVIREHPAELLLVFAACLTDPQYLYTNLQQFVGMLGWLSIQVPDWLVWTCFALLVLAAATQTRATRLPLPVRGLVLLFVAAMVGNTLAASWVSDVPKVVVDQPALWDQFRIPLQGRYWLPFALPILVLFSTGRTRLNPRYFTVAAVGIVLLASAVALDLIGITYYR